MVLYEKKSYIIFRGNFVSHERDPFKYEDLIQKLLNETEKIDLVIENLTQEFCASKSSCLQPNSLG